MSTWLDDALTIAQAGVLGEYDVAPTAVVLGGGRNVQISLAGLKDEDDPDQWQDAVRAVREELGADMVVLYFSAWTTVRRKDRDEALDTLVVQVGVPGRLLFRAFEQVRDRNHGVVTHLRELPHLSEEADPLGDPLMKPSLGNVFEPSSDSFRSSDVYENLIETIARKLNALPDTPEGRRAALH